jgi:hypothetical protein
MMSNSKLYNFFEDKHISTKYIKIEIKINFKITRYIAINNTTDANSGAGTAYFHEHLGSSPVLVGFDLVCVYFVELLPSHSTRVHPRCLVWFVLL